MNARSSSWACVLSLVSCLIALSILPASILAMVDRPAQRPPTASALGLAPGAAPMVVTSDGDTTWVQVHAASVTCPGDPNLGHGGEATGGPEGADTWCFEGGEGDSCGTISPWTTNCFQHVDVRTLPSQMNINYWHVDTYRTNQQPYCNSYALWCGSAAQWEGEPVECGTWHNPPGYGNQWSCYVQLTLPPTFSVAEGCTLFFDPRYDTECIYDNFYVDYWNGTQWKTLARFNATSNDPGAACDPGQPNPDYFGNTDVNRLVNCNWQARSNPNEPAFTAVILPGSLVITAGPKFRWRFISDGAWSDADGRGNTDGAAFIDNVWVWGAPGYRYAEDFESGLLDPAYWSLPNPPGVLDAWHISHDPDPPYEGGDGASRTTCHVDSSFMYRSRPEQGYPAGVPWRNGWYYRLMTPSIPVQNSGCVVQYDAYWCTSDATCDYGNALVRFHDSQYGKWCPWIDPTEYELFYNCFFWQFDIGEDISRLYGPTADSLQYCWEVMDVSAPGDACRGKHTQTDFLVDNVSVGFFEENRTTFVTREMDLLHDSFLPEIDQAYNSFFDAYDPASIDWYRNSRHELPRTSQLYLDVTDKDGIDVVKLYSSIDAGATWIWRPMALDFPADPLRPGLGGKYYGTVRARDFYWADTSWNVGSEIWYHVVAIDSIGEVEYLPERARPNHPAHDNTVDDQFHFAILPLFPSGHTEAKILLVDGHNRRAYDYSPCLSTVTNSCLVEDVYEQTLKDAGYCYDKFDIGGAGTNQQIQPIWFSDYDAVVWFTGPYFSNYLFWPEAQQAIVDYLADSGNVVICGDWVAFDLASVAEGGNGEGPDFLAGALGTDYLSVMESGIAKPYLYAGAPSTLNLFGTPTAISLDSVLLYRECPYLKDMSYIQVNPTPPAGWTAQPLFHLLNPTGVPHADEAVYAEYMNAGQCVFLNFDLSAMINQTTGFCDGNAVDPAPDFLPGTYAGRADLMLLILEDIFGLPPGQGGAAGVTAGEPGTPGYHWALAQNSPNPLVGTTEIRYAVARAGKVRIAVYSPTGQMVTELVNGTKQPGEYRAAWDGRNSQGARVSSGVYFYKFEGPGYKAMKKMLVVR